jgi:hypothetical protein
MPEAATLVSIDGRSVTIRPIRATDVVMETEFVRRLSPETRRYRFFGALNDLSAVEAKRLCDVDGDQSMAFVASVQEKEGEVEIGVCRYAPATSRRARDGHHGCLMDGSTQSLRLLLGA